MKHNWFHFFCEYRIGLIETNVYITSKIFYIYANFTEGKISFLYVQTLIKENSYQIRSWIGVYTIDRQKRQCIFVPTWISVSDSTHAIDPYIYMVILTRVW